MTELRKDLTSGRWVIIATERSKRPDDFRAARPPERVEEKGSFCPFCEGNESKTPPEVYSLRKEGTAPDSPGWRVRVVPNKFPALTRGAPPVVQEDGIFRRMDGVGVHEVLIETTEHGRELADLPLEHVEDVVRTYRNRLENVEREFQYQYVHIFKNKGKEAGASLNHPHSQIIATPIIPKKIAEELNSADRLYDEWGECIFCRTIEEEIRRGERLVLSNDHFCVLAPYAPRFPFELRLYPLRHSAYFTLLEEVEVKSLARTLQEVLSKLKNILGDPPFNYYLHIAPNPGVKRRFWALTAEFFHWHMEIIPVLSRAAGFEWGTGFYINPVTPEAAARFLRESSAL